MEANNTITENKNSQVQKISDTNYILIKDSQTYQMNITWNENNLNINVKRVLGTKTYETVFTIEDLHLAAKFFSHFEDLKDIHHEIIQKLNDQSLEFSEEVDFFTFKFEFPLGTKKTDAVLKIKKRTEQNIEGIVDEIGKNINDNSELIKDLKVKSIQQIDKIVNLEEKNSNNEVKLAILEEKNNKLEEILSKRQEIIASLLEELRILKKNGMNLIESSQIVKEEEVDLIKKWIDPTNYNKVYFKLLYRATEHGKSAKEFHSRCDYKVKNIKEYNI